MQVEPESKEKFVRLCERMGVTQLQGFSLALEAWEYVQQSNDQTGSD